MPTDPITRSQSWTNFEQVLGSLGADHNAEKGRAFEELTRLHLLSDPVFATKLTDVWHHTEVPQKIADELGLQRPEIGVDLIARTRNGDYWAIQCKYHQDRSRNVTYDELKTFLSITERQKTYERLSHRLICTSAYGISGRVTRAHPEKIGFLTAAEFTRLGPEEFENFHVLLSGERTRPESYKPRPHQKRAVANAIKHYQDGGNALGKLIHPCGSGKSLTAYWISEELGSQTVLIAVPSLSLVRQALGTWTREAVAKNHDMEWLAVCSDEDVSKTDDPAMHSVDLGIDVTTDPRKVADFLSKPAQSVKVVMTTYQSGRVVSEGARLAGASFDLGVFDEAHKTVGSGGGLFAHLLSDANLPIHKRMYMTATERQYKGNSDDILSMDDRTVYGDTFDLLSFKAALELDPPILSDYRIISTVVTKSEIEKLIAEQRFVRSDGTGWSLEGDAPTFASLVALRKSIEKYDIRHTVSFHRSIRRAKDFAELNDEASKAGPELGSLQCFHVSGDISTGKRAAIMDRFVDATPSLITNARCLTEGVDVPAIDAVLFADARRSKVDIVQAAGRAIRRFDGKELGYIIVPVIIDEETDDPSDDAFDQIIAVLSALAMQDERIIEEFKSIASSRRSSGTALVDIDVPEFVRIEFGDLISNIELKIWDRLSFGWHKGYERLQAFVALEGHAMVPKTYTDETGFPLGQWAASRRRDYKNNVLSPERIAALEALPGWDWDRFDSRFEEGFERLKKFVESTGHAKVPQGYVDETGFRLGNWATARRQERKDGILSAERVAALDALPGWDWDRLNTKFETGFQHLKKFIEKAGHANVPHAYEDETGYSLGTKVGRWRAQYRNGTLSAERVAALEAIPGWVWDDLARLFEEGLERLKKFVDTNGHAKVPKGHVDNTGFRLGGWASDRRKQYKNDKLSPERVAALEALPGWVWSVRASQVPAEENSS